MLHGIFHDPYFSHYALLVAAMHILFGESIPERSLSRANRYLQRLCEMFASLHGQCYYHVKKVVFTCTYIVHRRRCMFDEYSKRMFKTGDHCGHTPVSPLSPSVDKSSGGFMAPDV